MSEQISPRQFHEAVGVEDWRVLGEGACTFLRTGSFAGGARLVQAISGLAGLDDHHPPSLVVKNGELDQAQAGPRRLGGRGRLPEMGARP